jgi:PTH1 family peptidyl-tRNA hydrolase
VDHFARVHSIALNKNKDQARVGWGRVGEMEVLLAKPKTFMNESGRAVNRLLRNNRIPVTDLLVIYDDMDLPLGRLRIRKGGSSGGHKGIASIISYLGEANFARLRLGIGHPGRKGAPGADNAVVVDYVLGEFRRDEEEAVTAVLSRAAEAISCVLTEGVEAAMNNYNAQV